MIPVDLASFANHLWQSTLFAAAAGFLALALRKNRAAVRFWLWMIASVKFLVPFSLLVGIGGQFEWRAASAIARPEMVSVVEDISRPFSLPALPRATPAASLPPAASLIPVVVFFLWLCGFAVVVFLWLRDWRRMRQTLHGASPLQMKIPIKTMSSPACVEPGVIGILRPVLLLPHGITERLSATQLRAILLHELCHARRRDNLAAAIHMVVETLFWFHPLVWWLERRLVEERERACDQEVLRVLGEPEAYAEGILSVCKLYKESPLVCMSGVTGSNLKNRIEEIMTNRSAQRLGVGRTLLLAAAALVAVAVPLAYGMVSASQDAFLTPSVASLFSPQADPQPKPGSNPANVPPSQAPGNRIDAAPATAQAAPQAGTQAAPPARSNSNSGNFMDEMTNAGYRDLSVDSLIALKIHGVTGDYVREMRAAGYQPDVDELVSLKIHGVDADYIRQMRAAIPQLTLDELISFRIHGVTVGFINDLKQAGWKDLNPDDLIGIKVQGVTPEFIRLAQTKFKDLTLDQIMQLKMLGILETQ